MKGIAYREYDATGDEPFVYSAWIRSHRDMARRHHRAPHALDRYRLEVGRHINQCPPVMMTSDENSATLLGFACASPTQLHFVYVIGDLRCVGLGKRLIERAMGSYGDRIDCTHRWPWKSGRFVYEQARAA